MDKTTGELPKNPSLFLDKKGKIKFPEKSFNFLLTTGKGYGNIRKLSETEGKAWKADGASKKASFKAKKVLDKLVGR